MNTIHDLHHVQRTIDQLERVISATETASLWGENFRSDKTARRVLLRVSDDCAQLVGVLVQSVYAYEVRAHSGHRHSVE